MWAVVGRHGPESTPAPACKQISPPLPEGGDIQVLLFRNRRGGVPTSKFGEHEVRTWKSWVLPEVGCRQAPVELRSTKCNILRAKSFEMSIPCLTPHPRYSRKVDSFDKRAVRKHAAHVAAWIAYGPKGQEPGLEELQLLRRFLTSLGAGLLPSRLKEVGSFSTHLKAFLHIHFFSEIPL